MTASRETPQSEDSTSSFHLLEMDPERALFEGKLEGLVLPFYANERPLRGLAGLMDWRFQGLISRSIRSGAIQGGDGECVYIPAIKGGKVFHLLLVGGGHLTAHGRRGLISDDAFKSLRKSSAGLKLERLGLSRADFGGLDPEYLSRQLKGARLWILP